MMSEPDKSRRQLSRRPLTGVTTCPACGRPVKPNAKWCGACQFTGADSIAMFPGGAPPLMPVLDAAEILTERDIAKINGISASLGRRFPQFRWRVCTVTLPLETRISLFGFWMFNASPLGADETADERAWTVLLLINSRTGEAAVVPGYAAEPYLSDDEWKAVMSHMAAPWREGKAGEAVVTFFDQTRKHLQRAWKRYGARNTHDSPA